MKSVMVKVYGNDLEARYQDADFMRKLVLFLYKHKLYLIDHFFKLDKLLNRKAFKLLIQDDDCLKRIRIPPNKIIVLRKYVKTCWDERDTACQACLT